MRILLVGHMLGKYYSQALAQVPEESERAVSRILFECRRVAGSPMNLCELDVRWFVGSVMIDAWELLAPESFHPFHLAMVAKGLDSDTLRAWCGKFAARPQADILVDELAGRTHDV